MRIYMIFAALLSLVILFSCKGEEGPGSSNSGSGRTLLNISVEEAKKMLEQQSDHILLDVRTPGEFNDGHIEGALNIDYYERSFKTELAKLDKDKSYIVYCRSGNRSAKTLSIMRSMGFKTAYNVLGGINVWKAKGYKLVK